MSNSKSVRTTARRTRSVVLVAVVAAGALAGVLGFQSLATSSSLASPFSAGEPRTDVPRDGDRDGTLGVAGGAVPDGVTVFDDELPAVTNLDPELLGAVREAAADAEIDFYVNSGWRSPAYQEQLLQEAVSEYGSKEEAARWVATADTSPHVSGDAVDIGDEDATAWLSEYGAEYGLCQIYGNEPWHYELRTEAPEGGCPPMYADPTQDPRMQQ